MWYNKFEKNGEKENTMSKKPLSKRKRTALAVFISALLTLLSIALTAASYFASSGYVMYREALEQRPLDALVSEIRSDESYIKLEELPELYKDGVVAVEDSRFYYHSGIDLISIARAFFRNIREMSLVSGGSTITQQLAKNMFFTFEKRFERKAAEVYMAHLIESKYTKEEILELYVNYIDFGNGYRGVREASLAYYGKEPMELTEEEISMLIGIPNKPAVFSADLESDESKKKQEEVYERLVDVGLITE